MDKALAQVSGPGDGEVGGYERWVRENWQGFRGMTNEDIYTREPDLGT